MKRTVEQEYLHEIIENHVASLRKEIKELKDIIKKKPYNILEKEFDKHPVEETIGKEIDFSKNPLYAGNHIRTVSGIYINVFEIEKQRLRIHLEDIAHALSHQCRFSGHTKTFYSVAEHSLYIADMVPDEHKLAALLHDASEAYLVDIPAPIKPRLANYKELETKVMNEIAQVFDIQFPFSKEVKNADIKALNYEWENFMLKSIRSAMPIEMVKKQFIKKFHEYSKLTRKRY